MSAGSLRCRSCKESRRGACPAWLTHVGRLLSDSPLIDQLAHRQLAALAHLTPARRRRLTETFGAWLETRGDAGTVAQRLRIHPQTVRYRIHQIEQILADQLEDPDARFAMEIVLRAMRLRDRAHRPGP